MKSEQAQRNRNIVISFMQLGGWRRIGAAMLCGAFLTAALPPLHLLPFIIPAFVGLLLLLEGASSPKQAFIDGWWFGCGFFVSGIYWISISLLTDPERFAWLIPFAVFGLSALLALYCGVAAWLTYLLPFRASSRIVLFAAIWAVMEWVRGHALTGFPWNLAGYVWSFADAPMQIVSVVGIYGLSFLTVILAAMPTAVIMAQPQEINKQKRVFWITLLIALCLIGWGQWRVMTTPVGFVPKVMLRLVQGNIPQKLKWNEAQKYDNLQHHINLTTSEGYDKITHVIWAESSIPFLLQPQSSLVHRLGKLAPAGGGALITGAVRVDEKTGRIYNSVRVIDGRGNIIATYDKHRLVPFGEFIPLRRLLPLTKITHGSQDFSRGNGAQTLAIPNLPPFSPLICYEAAFPELAVSGDVNNRPAWLLNLTNDAWFGNSSGPYQHFHIARTRAIEQGLPLIRLAGSGISAVIDPLGRVLAQKPLGKTGIIDSKLPLPLADITPYGRYRDKIFLLLVYMSVIMVIIVQKKEVT